MIFQRINRTNNHIKQLAGNDLLSKWTKKVCSNQTPNKLKLTTSKFKFHLCPKFLSNISSNSQVFALSSSHLSSLRLASPLPSESSKPSSQSSALPPRRLGWSYKNIEKELLKPFVITLEIRKQTSNIESRHLPFPNSTSGQYTSIGAIDSASVPGQSGSLVLSRSQVRNLERFHSVCNLLTAHNSLLKKWKGHKTRTK